MPSTPEPATLRNEYYDLLLRTYNHKLLRRTLIGSAETFAGKMVLIYHAKTSKVLARPDSDQIANFLRGLSVKTLTEIAYFTETFDDADVERPIFWDHLQALRAADWTGPGSPLFFRFDKPTDKAPEKPVALNLFPAEITAADHLRAELLRQRSANTVCTIQRHAFDGEDILPLELGHRLMRGDAALGAAYDTILFALPAAHSGGTPAADMLEEVYHRLGLTEADDLAEKLRRDRILLVLSGAERITAQRGIEDAFWKAFAKKVGRSTRDVCRLLLIRAADAGQRRPRPIEDRTIDFPDAALSIPALSESDLARMRDPEDKAAPPCPALDLFHDLLAHYAAGRPALDRPPRDPTDYRLRLAEWDFSVGAQTPRGTTGGLRPCDIRARAFLSANRDVFAMDVTIGFTALSGLPEADWPAEIRVYHRAVAVWLAGLEADEGKAELLQFISTGLFWVQEDTLRMLCRMNVRLKLKKGKDAETASHLFKTTIFEERRKFMDALVDSGIVRRDVPAPGAASDVRYMMPLGVRAIVQDRWSERNAAGRSVAHLAIANRMIKQAQDRRPLAQEMPFAPVIGRGRRFYLLETIRHALVAAQTGDLKIMSYQKGRKDESPYGFADGVFHFAWPGSSPEYLRDRTYARLFIDELSGGAARSLVRRYGLYRVAAEALYLFECAGFVPADPVDKVRFLRMQGYASLEIGAIGQAEAQFAAMRTAALDITDADAAERFEFGALMGLADAALERGDLPAARALLAKVVPPPEEPRDDAARAAWRDRRRRLAARQAAICLQDVNDHAGAHRILGDELDRDITFVSHSTPDTMELVRARYVAGNNGHRFIEATIAAAEGRCLDDALIKSLKRARITCGDNALFGRDSGNLHSQLGYRIQYASLQRLLGEVEEAEAEMERVRDYAANYGASVRTLFALQIEAGATLLARGLDSRPIRALGIYLVPCFDRAQHLGYRTWSGRAARVALAPARELLAVVETLPPGQAREMIAAGLAPTSTGYIVEHQLSKLSNRIPQHLFTPATVRAAATVLSDVSALRDLVAGFVRMANV